MLVTGVYVTIDGIFVGHYLGEAGLAGMMLAYPVRAILYAIGAMIGMGSAALVSINLGQGNVVKARKLLGNAFSLCLLAGGFFALMGGLFSRDILIALGAQGDILENANQYLFWYFALCHFPIISMAFTTLLRNDGRPSMVTFVLILGGTQHFLRLVIYRGISLWFGGRRDCDHVSAGCDGLTVFTAFFGSRTQLKINLEQMKLKFDNCVNIARVGLPSFLMNLYLSIVLTLHNTAFLWVGGPLHVAAYGVVSYTEAFFYLIFEGIALGTQPIYSFNAGAGRFDRVKQARNIAFTMTLLTAALGLALIYSRPEWLVYLFAGDNPNLTPVAIEGMRWYFWGLPMEGLILVGASFFQAINCSKQASILTGTKLVLIAAIIYCFAWAFGVIGVWISLATCSTLLTLWMFYAMKKVDNRLP